MASKELAPITHENLKQIFTSRDFLGGIKKATKIGLEKHVESQFSFWRGMFSNKIKCFSPSKATHHQPFSIEFDLDQKDYENVIDQKLMPLLLYHCHSSPYICPSEQDLLTYFEIKNQYNLFSEGYIVRTIINHTLDCIGAIREKGKFHDILVMQNHSKKVDLTEGEFAYQQIFDKLGRRRDDNVRLTETLDCLHQWNAHLLTYERMGKSYGISENQLSGLEKFAYTPVLNPDY